MSDRGRLILLVEDEPGFRESLAYLLRRRDFEVVTADTADAALAAIDTRQPDGAIVDLHLKQGSGRDVVSRMPWQASVIIFSGPPPSGSDLERRRPHTRRVERPASLTWLVNTLEEMMGSPRVWAGSAVLAATR